MESIVHNGTAHERGTAKYKDSHATDSIGLRTPPSPIGLDELPGPIREKPAPVEVTAGRAA